MNKYEKKINVKNRTRFYSSNLTATGDIESSDCSEHDDLWNQSFNNNEI